jgi:hypothetical protein
VGDGQMAAHISNFVRFYTAALIVRLARYLLVLAHRLYRAGILSLAGVRFAIVVSEELRKLSWRLVR